MRGRSLPVKKIAQQDRVALIRLASTLQTGSEERRVLLSFLKESGTKLLGDELNRDVLRKYQETRDAEMAKPVVRGQGLTPKEKVVANSYGNSIQEIAEKYVSLIPEFNQHKNGVDEGLRDKDPEKFWPAFKAMRQLYWDNDVTYMLQRSQGPKTRSLFESDIPLRDELVDGLKFMQFSVNVSAEYFKRQTSGKRASE